MRLFFRTAIVLFILLLSACVSVPQKAFNRGASNLKTIRVQQMAHDEIGALFPHPGLNFGLVGAAVAISDLTAKGNKLETQFQTAGLDYRAVFKESFEKAMQERGYALIWSEPMTAPKKGAKVRRGNWKFRKTYGAVDDADAQLDVNLVFVGYAASGATDKSPYRPSVTLSAKLLDASGKKTLFSDVVVYHNHNKALKKAIAIEPDPAYAYADFDALTAAGARAAEGLDRAIRASAQTLAEQL